jgi:hypothetical protein
MTTPLNYSPSSSAVYYKPPKRLEIGRTIIGGIVAALVIAIGSFFYGTLFPDLRTLYLRTGAVIVGAGAVGLIALIPVHYGKVRSPLIAAFIGAFLSLFALYIMWLAWVHKILVTEGFSTSYDRLILRPIWLFRVILRLNAMGTWSYGGEIARGGYLLFLWLGEAALILTAGVLIPVHRLFSSDPICYSCALRCTRVKNLPRFSAEHQDALVGSIEARDFSALPSYPAAKDEDDPELSLTLMSCPRCRQTNVLTINRIGWENEHGRLTIKSKPILNQMLIGTDDADQLKTICQQIQAARAAALSETP